MNKITLRLEDVRFRFFIVGLVNTIVGVGMFTLSYLLFKQQMSYLLILLLSQGLAVLFSHFTQRKFVWRSNNSYLLELGKFGSSYLLITAVNVVSLSVAVEYFDLPVLPSQYTIGAVLILSSYLIQKRLVFAKPDI